MSVGTEVLNGTGTSAQYKQKSRVSDVGH